MTSLRILRYTLIVATGAILTSCATVKVQQRPITTAVSPSAYDRHQAEHSRNAMHHAMPANTPAARAAWGTKRFGTHSNGTSPPPPGPFESSQSEQGIRYPGDVQFHGGNVVQSAEEYLIYVNLASSASCHTIATCWGDPSGFLHDLGLSDFIHMVDQYVRVSYGDRYRVSPDLINVNYTPTAGAGQPFTDIDIQTIVHAVVRALALPGPQSVVYFDPSNVILNGHRYLAQPEYSNDQHACSITPGGSGQ